jgi:hypothetical protein
MVEAQLRQFIFEILDISFESECSPVIESHQFTDKQSLDYHSVGVLLYAGNVLKINNFLFELNLFFFNFLIVALRPIAFRCFLKHLQNLGFHCEIEKESDFPILCEVFIILVVYPHC